MNLEDLQGYIHTTLSGNSTLAGVPIIQDDGTYDLPSPDRQAYLRTKGLLLVVWQIMPGDLTTESETGVAEHWIKCSVLIEENILVNRTGAEGTRMPWEKAVRLVLDGLSGKPAGGQANHRRTFQNPSWDNRRVLDGVHEALVTFKYPAPIIPSS